jgi:phage FluMu protein Com
METVKCRSCSKLLAKIGRYDQLEIKCPRCKTLNYLSVTNAPLEHQECLTEQEDERCTIKAKL